eukprot:jgi/Chlat1/6919/Chrsp52S06597
MAGVPPGAGRGRGMGATLPAWMKAPGAPPGPPPQGLPQPPQFQRPAGMPPQGGPPSFGFQTAPQQVPGPGYGMGPPRPPAPNPFSMMSQPTQQQGLIRPPQPPGQYPGQPPQYASSPFGGMQQAGQLSGQPGRPPMTMPQTGFNQVGQLRPIAPPPPMGQPPQMMRPLGALTNHLTMPGQQRSYISATQSATFSALGQFSSQPGTAYAPPTQPAHPNMQQFANAPAMQQYSQAASALPAAPPSAPAMPAQAPTTSATSQPGSSDWTEHTAPDGRKYYFNTRTKQSSWEKPAELMSHIEASWHRADAETPWKEFTTADGRKYYYNKTTRESKWTMPDELKAARDRALARTGAAPAPAAPAPFAAVANITPTPTAPTEATQPASSPPAAQPTTPQASKEDMEASDAKKQMSAAGKVNVSQAAEPAAPAKETITYASKQEARMAFKELLADAEVGADWTWEQAMKKIINDERYSALKTLGERRHAFHEYITAKKKEERDLQRQREKLARESFTQMLQECAELKSTMRYSKAVPLLEKDTRFHEVKVEREREELYEEYMYDLEKKEKERARLVRRQNMAAFRELLEEKAFITASSQWRKVQEKIEDDPRYEAVDKIDRLDVFQDYIKELEKKELEQKQLEKEERRRQERKNRDVFVELMTDHASTGVFNASTSWKEYLALVKDHEAYKAVQSNSSGSTPKELFHDYRFELDEKYHAQRSKIKEALRERKFSMKSTTTLEEFKAALAEAAEVVASIPEMNVKLAHEDFAAKAKEKEEKEAKRKKRAADEFLEYLKTSSKVVTASSTWADVQSELQDKSAYKAVDNDEEREALFNQAVEHLQQKEKEKADRRAKEKEEKERKEKEKVEKKEKERLEKEKERAERKEKEKAREKERKDKEKQRTELDKKHISAKDKDKDKKKRRHHEDSPSETRDKLKRHKSEKESETLATNGEADEELEDGELGEEGEI